MGVRIVGTGHILRKSVEEVRRAIQEDTPDMVAVELDFKRFHALEGVGFDPGSYRGGLKDLLTALVGGGSFPVLLEGVLGLIQKELGEKYGIYPGSDMCAAIVSARDSGCRIALVDRGIEITMNHLMRVPLKEIIQLLLSREEDVEIAPLLLDGNIEGILEKDVLEAIMGRLKEKLPVTYGALVDERDQYMAHALHRIQEDHPGINILAVVGAGHKKGIQRYLDLIKGGYRIDKQKILEIAPVSGIRVLLLIFMVFVAFILIKSGVLFIGGKKK